MASVSQWLWDDTKVGVRVTMVECKESHARQGRKQHHLARTAGLPRCSLARTRLVAPKLLLFLLFCGNFLGIPHVGVIALYRRNTTCFVFALYFSIPSGLALSAFLENQLSGGLPMAALSATVQSPLTSGPSQNLGATYTYRCTPYFRKTHLRCNITCALLLVTLFFFFTIPW